MLLALLVGRWKNIATKPAENLIKNSKPNFPFFFAWANHSWKGVFFGANKKNLIEQKYGGQKEIEKHFNYLLQFFNDKRYYKIENKPVLQIYDPKGIPNCKNHLEILNQLAIQNKFEGIYFIGENVDYENKNIYGLDAVTP